MDPFFLAILLYFIALTLAVIDLFVPSGGILMILAGLAALACILFGFQSSQGMGMSMIALVAASVPVFAVVAIRIWPHTPIGRRIILRLPQPGDEKERADREVDRDDFVGKVFVAQSPIMPSGHLRVGSRNLNIVAENGFIDAGQHLKIMGFRNRNWIARLTDEPPSPVVASSAELEESTAPNLLDVSAEELGLDSIEDEPDPNR